MTEPSVWRMSGKRNGLAASGVAELRCGALPGWILLWLLVQSPCISAQTKNPDGNGGGGGGTVPVLSLSSSGSPSIYGGAVTFRASMTPASCSSSAATASFYDNGTLIGTAYWTEPLANATLTTSSLAAGSHTITLSSPYPGSTSCVAPVSTTITQTVNQATPTITVATSGTPSAYGNTVTFTAAVSGGDTNTVTFLNGGVSLGASAVSGGMATLATSSLQPGTYSIAATIAAGGNYAASTSSALTQTVNRAVPTVSAWPSASAITYGQTLASSTLTGGAASVSGSFAWSAPGVIPGGGTQSEGVVFTPTNTTDDVSVTGLVSVTVNKVTPVISWATPAPIDNATPLSATQLDATASIAGTFSYSPSAGTVLSPGTQVLTATFTPSAGNAPNYNSATATVSIAVAAFDAGTLTLTVGNGSGTVFSSSTNFGKGSTPSSVAEALAAANASVRVTAVNDTLYIDSAGTGAVADYSYGYSITWNKAVFAQPSFQVFPASGSLSGGASASTAPQTKLYAYSITGYDKVGNVLNYNDSVMGVWSTATSISSCTTNTAQQSGYDCLNRLTSLHNTATTATSTQYAGVYDCWSYDAFGNRTAQNSQTSPCPAQASVQATARYNANNQVTWTSVNAAVNGFSYDAAGNVVNDNVNQYLYDGEGRICAVASTPVPGFTTLTGYVYDADGHRVAKGTITSMSCDPSLNGLTTAKNETEYILGQDGEPVSELAQDANGSMQWQRSYVYAAGALIGTYDPSPNPAYNASNPGSVSPVLPVLSFRLTDWQGTLRATTDASGVLQGTCTSLPYGDQLTCQGNIPDNLHFTGKERDAESGNDYFGARYYASNMGRFMTPDWAAKPIDVPYASFGDPQTLNLYAYAQNGPLNRVDAEGHASDQSIVTLPVNPGESCVSFSAPVQKCNPSSGGEVSESPEEVAYVALVQHEFAAAGNTVAQQQSQPLSPIDKVAMKAEAGALNLTRQALAGGRSAEYGGLILSKDSNGSLSSTSPIHTGETSVDIDSIAVPKGYTVVGEYHTHPSTTCCESVGPSYGDINRLRTTDRANRIGYVGDAFTGQVSRYTQREPLTGPYDTHTYGTVIGTVP